MEAQIPVPQQRSVVGHACGKMGREGRRLDTEGCTASASEGRRDCRSRQEAEAADNTSGEETLRHPQQKPRGLDPMVLEPPTKPDGIDPTKLEGIDLAIRGGSKTVVGWINGRATQKRDSRCLRSALKPLRDWWGRSVDLRRKVRAEKLMFRRYTFFGITTQKLTHERRRE